MKPFYVDVSIYKDDEERLKIEKEIFDIAVANGAVPVDVREGWTTSSMNLSGTYNYFGALGGIKGTYFSDDQHIFEAEQLTIEQLREKYPMNKEQDDVRTWGCFKQVANVIGEEAAVRELGLITHDMRPYSDSDKNSELASNFDWSSTPQGVRFWCDIDGGIIPEPYSAKENNPENQQKEPTHTNTLSEKENVSEVDTVSENAIVDMVKEPPHYLLFPEYNLEVKEINKRLLNRMEESTMDVTLYEAGWYQQAMQYLMRCYAKNQWEDIEKAHETLGFMLQSRKERTAC